ncbi:hypothetical protein FOA52_001441 [Chlamydomonas sp. UWO 241]|nr:hypothetical protein FOA52_001441 [Chlamydomonas sp. UWO 241]
MDAALVDELKRALVAERLSLLLEGGANSDVALLLRAQIEEIRAMAGVVEAHGHHRGTALSRDVMEAVYARLGQILALYDSRRMLSITELGRHMLGLSARQRSTAECAICYVEHAVEGMVYAGADAAGSSSAAPGCGHPFCFECMQSYVCTLVDSSTFPVQCPSPGCKQILAHRDVNTLLRHSPAHLQGFTCEAFQALPPHLRSAEDAALLQLSDMQRWKQCPRCSHMIERISGCSHMTCRCGTHFTY